MIAILVSSKTMEAGGARSARAPSLSTPDFLEEAHSLNRQLSSMGVKELQSMMKISATLAESTKDRIEAFGSKAGRASEGPACLMFSGDVYDGLDAKAWRKSDFVFAQKHLRILSGLYGVVRPMDVIRPYRLEPGYRWQPEAGVASLTAFWKERVTRHFAEALKELPPSERILVNLASKEFSVMVEFPKLDVPVVTPQFQEIKGGKPRTVALFTKRARGAMARWIVVNRLREPEALKSFCEDGYCFAAEYSDDRTLTFLR